MPRATQFVQPTYAGDGIIRSDDILADPRYGKDAPHRGTPEGHLPVRSYLAVPVASCSDHQHVCGMAAYDARHTNSSRSAKGPEPVLGVALVPAFHPRDAHLAECFGQGCFYLERFPASHRVEVLDQLGK
jgi:GAF domain-containing protein